MYLKALLHTYFHKDQEIIRISWEFIPGTKTLGAISTTERPITKFRTLFRGGYKGGRCLFAALFPRITAIKIEDKTAARKEKREEESLHLLSRADR